MLQVDYGLPQTFHDNDGVLFDMSPSNIWSGTSLSARHIQEMARRCKLGKLPEAHHWEYLGSWMLAAEIPYSFSRINCSDIAMMMYYHYIYQQPPPPSSLSGTLSERTCTCTCAPLGGAGATRRQQQQNGGEQEEMDKYQGILQELVDEIPLRGPDQLIRKLSMDINTVLPGWGWRKRDPSIPRNRGGTEKDTRDGRETCQRIWARTAASAEYRWGFSLAEEGSIKVCVLDGVEYGSLGSR